MTLLSPHGEPLKNPYEILGLERGVTDDDINRAFKKLMLKLHPDKQPTGQSEDEAAKIAETFHNVMAAKSFLLDSEHMSAKRAYDSKLASSERKNQPKFNIPSFDSKVSTAGGTSSKINKFKRRGSDCTDDRRSTVFKKTGINRRASFDDCSTTSQSSSGDDTPRKKKSNPIRRSEEQKQNKNKQKAPHHTKNTKLSRHQKNRSSIPKCKYSDSCNSFFAEKEPKKFNEKTDKKVKDRKRSVDNKISSLSAKSERLAPLSNVKSHATVPSSSPKAHDEAKQRITNSIEAISKNFKCPLTNEIMNDPVTDFEGNSYEREAILKYLEANATSPITGAPLYSCHLTADVALKEKIRCIMELKKTFDTLGVPQKKEVKHVTKHHTQSHQTQVNPKAKNLKESINAFIAELNSGSPVISIFTLDDNVTTNFSYLGIKFKLEVFGLNSYSVQTIFGHNKKAASISSRLVDWNKALQEIGVGGKLTFRNINGTFVFAFNKNMEHEEFKSRTFRYSIEYFLEFAIKLHNVINVTNMKAVGKVRLSV